MASKLLTKSRFLDGLRCDRLLWTSVNRPESLPSPDIVSQHIFEQGHAVDELAKRLHPNGVDIAAVSFKDTISKTKVQLGRGRPLFQAALTSDDLYSKVDILLPSGRDWELVEVKSSTEVKTEHEPDVAFQRYCCEKAGLSIAGCCVAHVNHKYVRNGEINPEEFFVIEDITERANAAAIGIEDSAAHMLKVMALRADPGSALSPRCRDPRDCALLEPCESGLPDHSVLTLHRGKRAGYELLDQGVQSIGDIPAGFNLTFNQAIQRECVLSDAPHADRDALRVFLNGLRYPLAYFDFETVNPAIPLYDGMRPYQRIPFQFSLIVVPGPGAEPQRFSFLAKSPDDPRPGLLAEMRRRIPDGGSLVVYSQGFERSVLRELGASFSEYRDWIGSLSLRIADLYEPFRKFNYYHPDQKGSASIKHVLPALTGTGYEGMDIAEGETASVLYWNVTHKPAPEAERQKVYADLERYCGKDTDGMRLVVEQLSAVCS